MTLQNPFLAILPWVTACGRVCAAAVVATVLAGVRSTAIAGPALAPPAESYPTQLVPAVSASSGRAAPSTDGDLPANLDVPPLLRPLLSKMWAQSQTFRRQCARLRAEPRIQVRVYMGAAGGHSGGRAATEFQRRGTGLEAAVYLRNRDVERDRIELIAHEFEHILEQLDGLDLARLARLSPTTVWVIGDHVFETQRAAQTGRAVAAEVGE